MSVLTPPVGKAWYVSTRHYFFLFKQTSKDVPLNALTWRDSFLFLMCVHYSGCTSNADDPLQSGETALHVAARYGNVDVVRYLCTIQANPDLADRVSASRQPCFRLETKLMLRLLTSRKLCFLSSVSLSRSRRRRCTAPPGTATRPWRWHSARPAATWTPKTARARVRC